MTKKYNKYFLTTDDYKSFISDLEEFIFDHEIKFLDRFAIGHSGNLTKFSINSLGADITYIVGSGAHVFDSIGLNDLIVWIDEINNES